MWWLTPLIVALPIVLLLLARTVGAGPYGGWAVPVLLLFFPLCGVLAARATRTALRSTPAWLQLVASGVAGSVGTAVSFWSWGWRPPGEPLLPALLACAAVPSMVWAAAWRGRDREATATAAATVVLWVVGVLLDR